MASGHYAVLCYSEREGVSKLLTDAVYAVSERERESEKHDFYVFQCLYLRGGGGGGVEYGLNTLNGSV